MRLKGTNKDIGTIGRELGVSYVLEVSVRRAGPNLRIRCPFLASLRSQPRFAAILTTATERTDDFVVAEKTASAPARGR